MGGRMIAMMAKQQEDGWFILIISQKLLTDRIYYTDIKFYVLATCLMMSYTLTSDLSYVLERKHWSPALAGHSTWKGEF